jgi:hypothetical protein
MPYLSQILAGVALLATCALAEDPAPKPVAFDTHDGYFVSNQFEPAAPVSFVVIKDQESFDKVFGVARVMGDKSHRLPPAAFANKFVVAAIHRGKAMLTYQVESVSADGPALVVRYSTKSTPSDSAEFACPLILSLDKGSYKAVRFAENARIIQRLEIPPPQALQIECQKPGTLTELTDGGATVLSIKGDGIGRATVNCAADPWPQPIILRAYLRGMESLTIANDRLEWKTSVLSHSGHPTLLHLWQDTKEGPALTTDSPYWTEIRRLGPDGKPVAGLPPDGGWFELCIPQALLTETRQLKVGWIDFYR